MNHVPLNTKDIGQEFLNIETKERSNPLPWNGQFSPQLIEVLLKKYAPKEAVALDPFAGSGTLLHEAAMRKIGGIAADINPAACYLARIYTLANKERSFREALVAHIDDQLGGLFGSDVPLFASCQFDRLDGDPDFLKKACDIFVQPEALLLIEALLVLSEFGGACRERKVLWSTWKKLRAIIRGLPYSSNLLTVLNCDARELPAPDSSIDLVLTSPPYINVFNYHQHYRSSTEALGWDLLSVAKSEIGSNRKNRGNRFLTVIQYCLDLTQVFAELVRVCSKTSRIIFVVGRESRVLGVPFYNGRIIASLATEAVGCELVTRQERVFRNRFGQSIYEDILHFVPAGSRKSLSSLAIARGIARRTLEDALPSASKSSVIHINDAIDRISDINPSPIYDPRAARVSI